jgi:hypothetical protein
MSGLEGRVDPGLLERFRKASGAIAWREVSRDGQRGRIAHLHDEEAYVLARGPERRRELVVESGPVGALVLLTEIDRRGTPAGLWAEDTAAAPFAQGSLAATWGASNGGSSARRAIPVSDLVGLARYALR